MIFQSLDNGHEFDQKKDNGHEANDNFETPNVEQEKTRVIKI